MAEEIKELTAKKVYDTVIAVLDERKWHYSTEENMVKRYNVKGDDLPMEFVISINADRQMFEIFSPFSFTFSEEKRVEGAVAACALNNRILYGCFDYKFENGNFCYRFSMPFDESEIGSKLIDFLISCSCSIVDDYNDVIFAFANGYLDVNGFMERIN